jgi:hypothetical protein
VNIKPKDFVRVLFQDLGRAKSRVGSLKASADLGTILRVTKLLPRTPHPLATHFYGHPWQRSLSDLFNKRTQLSSGSLVAELQWTAVTIANHADALNKFFALRQQCESEFLRGAFADATKTRETIETLFGVSLWGLQAKFLLLEYSLGLEANTRHLSEQNSQKNLHLFTQVTSNFLSMRAERQLSHDNYQHKLAKYLSSFDDYPQVKAFFEHTTGRQGAEFETGDEDMVLYYLSDGSLLDRCLHTVSLLQRLLTANLTDANLLVPSAKLICSTLHTPAARNLAALLLSGEVIKPEPFDLTAIEALDHYTEGDYTRSAEVSGQLLRQLPTAVQIFELYVKSLIFAGRPFESPFPTQSPAHEIAAAIDSVFRKSTSYSQALDTLSRSTKSLYFSPLAAGLRYVLAAERTPSTARRSEQIAILDSQFLNPKLCFIPDTLPHRLDVHKRLAVTFPGSLTMDFLSKLLVPVDAIGTISFPDRVGTERKLRYTATTLLERGNYSSAIPLLEKLYSGRRKEGGLITYPLYDEIVALLYDAYIRTENIQSALDVFVDNLLDQPLTIHGLNVLDLHKLIERFFRPALATNIKAPIFYAATLINPQSIFVPYDNFLSSYGCKRPTDLPTSASAFPIPLLTYFLSRVCTQKVMAGSFHFTGTEALENERLQILQHLCRTDPTSRPAYSEEIDQITQRLFIRRGIQKLDEGKIFVDEAGIRRTGEKLLAENFRRYLDISSLKGIEALRLLDSAISRVVLTTPGGQHVPEQKIDIDKLEAEGVRVIFRSHYALFKDLFIDVRDRFISSSEYGLDSYVSVRIRHGTLQGQLRSRFEAFHLLTQKHADTAEYQRNAYWDKELADCTWEEKDLVQSLLSSLSRDIDDITRRLKDEVIQVRTETRNPKGLFDFRFEDDALLDLFSEEFESISSFAEFMDRVFATLWLRTEEGCTRIRDYMCHDLKNEFVQRLTRLQTELRGHFQPGAASALLASIASGLTAVQNECDRIARWFTVTGGTFEAFTLPEIVSVCVASVNNVNPEVQISPIIDLDNRPISGQYFHAFFDILRTILDNALRHSGIAGVAPQVSITGRITEDKILLQMRNSIAPHVREKDPAKLLSERVATVRSSAVSDEVKREGGTGYVKVAKILEYDLHQHGPQITFAYPTSHEFQVSLELDGKDLFA